jgi:hypothetical protein
MLGKEERPGDCIGQQVEQERAGGHVDGAVYNLVIPSYKETLHISC